MGEHLPNGTQSFFMIMTLRFSLILTVIITSIMKSKLARLILFGICGW